jgi:glycosyltransferase involved in cell wall biosynthesis
VKTIDIVVAVRNEEECLPGFFQKLEALALPSDVQLGCIFVEDGSTDRTREIIRGKAHQNPRVKYIFLTEGRGQAPAIALGMAHSRADAIIMMDVDGGHPLDVIPRMAEGFVDGALAVQAIRRQLTQRSRYRDIGTTLFNRLYRLFTGIDTEKQNVYYRLVSRPLVEQLLKNNRWKHFLRIDYRNYKGDAVRYVFFDAAERTFGQSKYNFKRLLRFALTAVLSSVNSARFAVLIALMLAVGSLLLYLGFVLVALAILAGTVALCYLFTKMELIDVLKSFSIQESAV